MPKFSDAAEQAQDDGPDAQVEPGSWEPSEADDTADAEAAGEPEPEAKPSAEPERPPKPEHEPQPSPGSDAGSGADAPRRGRYVRSDAIKAAVRGREAEVVRAVGIPWRGGTDHIHCKYPSHADKHPSWRLDENGTVFCSAGCPRGSRPHSIFDAVSFMEGLDFEAAKIRVARREQLYGLEGALVPLRGLPIIEYAGGRLADATAEAEQILAERDQDLFQRGDSLVRLARESKFVISGERKTTGPRLLLVQHMNMRMRFNQARRLPEMEREAQGIRIDQRTG
jgi:hypothetical protein